MQKGFTPIFALIGILVLAGVVGGAFFLSRQITNSEGQKACTMDAKICPDGSGVERVGPNCEFAECPADETTNWKVYKDTASTLSFEYPSDWNLVEGPKQVKEETYDYEYLKLNGKEGEIIIMRANQLGGACPEGYEKIKLKTTETDTCHYTDNQGLENWSLYLNTVNGGTLDLFATVNKPVPTNRNTVVKILSSINF